MKLVLCTCMRRARRAFAAVAIAAVVLSLTGCAGTPPPPPSNPSTSGATRVAPAPSTASGASSVPTTTPATTTPTPSTTGATVYLVRSGSLAAGETRPVPSDAPAMGALASMLAGANAREKGAGLSSAIPAGTRVLRLSVAHGIAKVDLSAAFASKASERQARLRLAQVVYTLTGFASVRGVTITVGGRPLTTLGGVPVGGQLSRPQFESVLPAIFVEQPRPFSKVTSPLLLTGTANVFEAQFIAEIYSPSGKLLAHEAVHAAAGSGTRGGFSARVRFGAAQSGIGKLRVYEPSAKDGSAVHVVVIPIRM
jgi:spore germination protein GerM